MSSNHSIGAMNQLADALDKAGYTSEDVTKLRQGDLAGILSVLHSRAKIVHTDPIIRVYRPSMYPNWSDHFWVNSGSFQKLELSGPTEYPITAVEQWFHDKQKTDTVKGYAIYRYLKESHTISNCLGLADLLAIQAKGIDFFQKYFFGRIVFGWKSVVRSSDSKYFVPSISEHWGGKIILCWHLLDDNWGFKDPALRFVSQS